MDETATEQADGEREFLYVLRPTRLGMLVDGPTAEESAALGRHVEYLQALTENGTALLYGRTQTADERTLGLVIIRAGSAEEAGERMAADPAVAEGVMNAELFPYRIAGGALAGRSR